MQKKGWSVCRFSLQPNSTQVSLSIFPTRPDFQASIPALHCPTLGGILLSQFNQEPPPSRFLITLEISDQVAHPPHHPSGDIWSPWPAFSKNPLRSDCFILNAPLLLRFSLGNMLSTDLASWLWISTFPFCLWSWAQSLSPLQNPTSVVCTPIPVVPWIKTALLCFIWCYE